MAERKEELKSHLIRVKKKSGKAGLKLRIHKMKIMVSSTITSWQIDGKTMETVTDFIFLSSKITADGDCSHKVKRHLERSNEKPRQHIKKQRQYFANKGLYACESWTIKKTENQRTDAFKLWCWRRLLRVPWTARRSNQSYRKSILNIH